MARQRKIAQSVVRTITRAGKKKQARHPLARILAVLTAVFSLYELPLEKVRPDVFAKLRQDHWQVNNDDYVAAFQPNANDMGAEVHDPPLYAIGDMGFSGSTFYATSNQQYIVKSVPRSSEHSFFRNDLLEPYAEYVASHPNSLLVRICDFLCSPHISIGRVLRLAPSHHIVMDNIMYGQAAAKDDWEHWDLKPTSYFYPERDIASGRLTSEATKSQLADEFRDKIILSKEQADDFVKTLEDDTRLLADHNAVDYSLFLIRIKACGSQPEEVTDLATVTAPENDIVSDEPPAVPPAPPSWRTGVPSPDEEHIFRAAVLDFFWAKHKVQPRLMTILVAMWNVLVSRQGHMSITTTPEEYRGRFLKMCRGIVEVKEDV